MQAILLARSYSRLGQQLQLQQQQQQQLRWPFDLDDTWRRKKHHGLSHHLACVAHTTDRWAQVEEVPDLESRFTVYGLEEAVTLWLRLLPAVGVGIPQLLLVGLVALLQLPSVTFKPWQSFLDVAKLGRK